MAGHSKFANIKHKKERADLKRAKIFTRLGKEIMISVQLGGSEPQFNPRLRDVLTKARASNMPKDNIERLIKKASGGTDMTAYEEVTYEGYGPNGMAVIVKALTDNRNRTAANVRSAFTKGTGNMGQTGSVDFLFQHMGYIAIEKSGHIDEDALMELVLEAGASDFVVQTEGYEILTEPHDFSAVMEALGDTYTVLSAEVTYQPLTTVEISTPEHLKFFHKMMDLLDDDEDVQDVFHNAVGDI